MRERPANRQRPTSLRASLAQPLVAPRAADSRSVDLRGQDWDLTLFPVTKPEP